MATGALVPVVAPYVTAAGVESGRPVRGGHPQWVGYGLAANRLLGRGGTLIPHSRIRTTIPKAATQHLYFKVWPRVQCRRRMWVLIFELDTTTSAVRVKFTDPSSNASTFPLSGAAGSFHYLYHVEDVASPAGSETEFDVTVDEIDNVSDPVLDTIACFELPRPELAVDASEYGVNLDTMNQDRLVYTTTGVGPGAVATALEQSVTVAQRAGFFHIARSFDPFTTTSASFVEVFEPSSCPVLLGRQIYISETTRTVQVRARCSAGASTTGEVRFTMASGGTTTLTITSGMAVGWLTGTIDVDCEDLSTSDGRRSSRYDKCTIDWRVTSGANSISLYSVSVGNG